jgi:hypothetical protein
MGQLHELHRRIAPIERDAQARGDLYARVSVPLLGYAHHIALAEDRPDDALHDVEELDMAWTAHGFDLQRFWAMYARAEIRLYRGDDRAWSDVTSAEAAVRRSLLLRGQTMRISWLWLSARCAIAAASRQPGLLQHADQVAQRLEKERVAWARPLAAATRAAIAAHRGAVSEAVAMLRQAESDSRAGHMNLLAAASAQGRLALTGEPLPAETAQTFRDQAVVNPAFLSRMFVPGPW